MKCFLCDCYHKCILYGYTEVFADGWKYTTVDLSRNVTKKKKNMRLHLPKLSYVENRLKKHATLMSLFSPTMLHKITGVK